MLVSLDRARRPAWVPVLLVSLLIAALLVAPATAFAAAAGLADADDQTSSFLNRLLDEINKRRDLAGTQHLSYIPPSAAEALDGFFAKTMPSMAWPRPCMHHLVGGAFSWDYVLATGFGGEARGEVLACPGPEPYWTPDRAAEQWWRSPSHFSVLYADPYADAVACSASGVRGGIPVSKRKGATQTADAATAILCVTFREGGPSSRSGAISVADPSIEWETDSATIGRVESDADSEAGPGAGIETDSSSDAVAQTVADPEPVSAAVVPAASDTKSQNTSADTSAGGPLPAISPDWLPGIPQMGQ